MTQKIQCIIPSLSKSYEIEIRNGLFKEEANYLSLSSSKIAIITDDIIAPLYGEPLRQLLASIGKDVHLFIFPSGEQFKTRTTKERLEDEMLAHQFNRDIHIVGLGGGVVTDLAGYIAATYCRGVPFLSIPTSLLGMVDASVGGKTGVNTPGGKNMLGCIYQPEKVLIDPLFLYSLPRKELTHGVVESIKHGIIADYLFFDYLEQHSVELLHLDPHVLQKVIFESCRIKKEIVEQDVHEKGKRKLLNFGHTYAHALESLSGYTLPHGEAVALGILFESFLSVHLGFLSHSSLERIEKIFTSYNVPLLIPERYSEDNVIQAMRMDKKSLNGQPRFILITEIGISANFGSKFCTNVDESVLRKAIQWINHVMCCH